MHANVIYDLNFRDLDYLTLIMFVVVVEENSKSRDIIDLMDFQNYVATLRATRRRTPPRGERRKQGNTQGERRKQQKDHEDENEEPKTKALMQKTRGSGDVNSEPFRNHNLFPRQGAENSKSRDIFDFMDFQNYVAALHAKRRQTPPRGERRKQGNTQGERGKQQNAQDEKPERKHTSARRSKHHGDEDNETHRA